MRGGTDAHEHDYDNEDDYGRAALVFASTRLRGSPCLEARNRPRSRSRARARPLIRSLLLLCVLLTTTAHVGSPNVWYDGPAGPYGIRVLIRPPQVVPGLADIVVRVRGGADRVTVAPARFDTGDEGAPAPDIAMPIEGDAESFSARLWLMARGPYRIVVTIEGTRGKGTTIVPVMATAEQRLAMPGALGSALLAGSVFLFFGLISLVGAAVRESVLAPGEEPSPVRRQGARVAMMIAAPVAALLLFGGWRWWNAVDNAHRSQLDRPWKANASVTGSADGRLLTLQITDSIWTNRYAPEIARRFPTHTLIPDHGKLMHMFLIREGDLAGFAHVHPSTTDSTRFGVSLPPLPPGPYRVFADIVLESGATQTLVSRVVLGDSVTAGAAAAVAAIDADDAGWSGGAIGSLTTASTELAPGSVMRWSLPARIVAEQEVDLTVEVTDTQGTLVQLEPYMGMPGHAMVQHEDGSVFVHLHPMGTISVAAQDALRTAGGIALPASHAMPSASRITFPYAFPKPGRYRLWVQVKQSGRVLTGAKDVTVVAGKL